MYHHLHHQLVSQVNVKWRHHHRPHHLVVDRHPNPAVHHPLLHHRESRLPRAVSKWWRAVRWKRPWSISPPSPRKSLQPCQVKSESSGSDRNWPTWRNSWELESVPLLRPWLGPTSAPTGAVFWTFFFSRKNKTSQVQSDEYVPAQKKLRKVKKRPPPPPPPPPKPVVLPVVPPAAAAATSCSNSRNFECCTTSPPPPPPRNLTRVKLKRNRERESTPPQRRDHSKNAYWANSSTRHLLTPLTRSVQLHHPHHHHPHTGQLKKIWKFFAEKFLWKKFFLSKFF